MIERHGERNGYDVMETLTLHLMNTDFYMEVPKNSLPWKQQVTQWLQYVAKEWSRFESHNELAKLNEVEVGKTIQLSAALYHCLQQANEYYEATNGLFSPYLKLQLEQHGYRQSFPFQTAPATPNAIVEKPQQAFEFVGNHRVLKTSASQVDLGGFAKGYVVEQIANWLQDQGVTEYGLVDGGGDMKMWSSGEKEWKIGIADPFHPQQERSSIKMKTGAIATSNRSYRSWTHNGMRKHHILNGQTGDVATTPIIQATVVSPSLCEAEVGTKLCFLLQEHEQNQWFNSRNDRSARYLIYENGTNQWLTAKGGTQDVD